MKRKDPPERRPFLVPLPTPHEQEPEGKPSYWDTFHDEVNDAERALAAALVRRAEATSHRDPESARDDLDRAMLLDPTSAEPWYQLAILERFDDDALVALNEALARDPSRAAFYGARGEIYEREEDLVRALADYDRAVHLDRDRDTALWISARARTHRKLGRWDEAWRDYTTAFRRCPRFATLLHDRAQVLVEKGDLGAALGELDRVIAAHPDLLVCVREKALLCHRMGDHGEALRAIDHVLAELERDPKSRDGFDHYIRGAILFATSDAAGALVAFEAGMSDDVSLGPFQIRRAQCLLALGREGEALTAADAAVADIPYNEEYRLWRSRVLQRIGGRDSLRRALQDVRRAIERAPDDARYVEEKAVIHARQGRRALARREARRALALARKATPQIRAYHALLEHYEARGLDLGHAPPAPREVITRIARG